MVSYETFLQQCCGFIRVQAWYVWRLHVRCAAPSEQIFGNALVRFLYQPEDAAGNSAWHALQAGVLEQCRAHGPQAETGPLEDRILGEVRTVVDDAYVADVLYARYRGHYESAAPFHGFTHDISDGQIVLHFTNTFDPDSAFRHPGKLRQGLARLLQEARAHDRGAARETCGTWLNSRPAFSDLFPTTWCASAEASAPAGHGGWWGQFTDRRGELHRANAEHLRRTGDFRYPFLRCSCGVAELWTHLQ